jgi:hypothetical protein
MREQLVVPYLPSGTITQRWSLVVNSYYLNHLNQPNHFEFDLGVAMGGKRAISSQSIEFIRAKHMDLQHNLRSNYHPRHSAIRNGVSSWQQQQHSLELEQSHKRWRDTHHWIQALMGFHINQRNIIAAANLDDFDVRHSSHLRDQHERPIKLLRI